MTALLSLYRIDLQWADEQYWITLTKVIRDMEKLTTKPKKEKVSASQMQSFIR